MNKLRARSLMDISQIQYGFMPDRGTRNAIFVLRRLVERSIQKQKDVHMFHRLRQCIRYREVCIAV